MAVNVNISQKGNENPMGVLRRFRNRVKTSGVLRRARSLRYRQRPVSQFKQKKSKLTSLERAEKRNKLIKLGKIGE